jgi:hypothetical protein
MTPAGKLCAWVEKRCGGFLGAFVGENATTRTPATRLCASADEARQWVEVEAEAFGLPVKWVSRETIY